MSNENNVCAAEPLVEVNKRELLAALRAAGAASAEVTYSGYGDSGDIDSACAYCSDSVELKLEGRIDFTVKQISARGETTGSRTIESMGLEDALKDFAYDVLETRHGGWELHEGAGGKLTINVEAGCFTLAHNDFYTEVDHTESEL